ncbi:MAG: hypothetical protein ACO3CN_07085, partial [Candidatus Nanopelagicales bacterium]
MRSHPFLNPIEAALVRWLASSPRIGYIAVKQHSSLTTWILRDHTDLMTPIEEELEEEEEPL